jgi:hypothetical protein
MKKRAYILIAAYVIANFLAAIKPEPDLLNAALAALPICGLAYCLIIIPSTIILQSARALKIGHWPDADLPVTEIVIIYTAAQLIATAYGAQHPLFWTILVNLWDFIT